MVGVEFDAFSIVRSLGVGLQNLRPIALKVLPLKVLPLACSYCRIGGKTDRRRPKTSLVSCLALHFDAFWTLPSIGVCVRKSGLFEASPVWGLAEDEAAGNERERDRVREIPQAKKNRLFQIELYL